MTAHAALQETANVTKLAPHGAPKTMHALRLRVADLIYKHIKPDDIGKSDELLLHAIMQRFIEERQPATDNELPL